ncbi:MAG: ABC transporter substrate-binding protein, partial [Bacteroidia bacterium]
VNYFHYRNAEFDQAYEKAQRETRDSIKKLLYQKMDQIIVDDAPVIPLYYDEVVRLVHHNIKGLTANPMNLLNLKTVSKEKAEK